MREVITRTTDMQVIRIKLDSLLLASEVYKKLTETEKKKLKAVLDDVMK